MKLIWILEDDGGGSGGQVSDDEDRSSNGSGGGRESVSITEMEACLDNGNAFNRLEIIMY